MGSDVKCILRRALMEHLTGRSMMMKPIVNFMQVIKLKFMSISFRALVNFGAIRRGMEIC